MASYFNDYKFVPLLISPSIIMYIIHNSPVLSNYASVQVNNNLKSRLGNKTCAFAVFHLTIAELRIHT